MKKFIHKTTSVVLEPAADFVAGLYETNPDYEDFSDYKARENAAAEEAARVAAEKATAKKSKEE